MAELLSRERNRSRSFHVLARRYRRAACKDAVGKERVFHGHQQPGTGRQGARAPQDGPSRPSWNANSRTSTRTRPLEEADRYAGDPRHKNQSFHRGLGCRRAAQADVGSLETRSSARRSATRKRTLVSELRGVRNHWAHQRVFSGDDAYRALDSAARLLTAVSAPQAGAVEKMKMETAARPLR